MALAYPSLAWAERKEATGPHYAALEVGSLFRSITGRLPSFDDHGG